MFYERVTLANIWRPSRWRWVEVAIASAAALFLVVGLSGLVWQSRRVQPVQLAKSGAPVFDTTMEKQHPGYFRYAPSQAAQSPSPVEPEALRELERDGSIQQKERVPATGTEDPNVLMKSAIYGNVRQRGTKRRHNNQAWTRISPRTVDG